MSNNGKSALICGISGQDGSYLADFLLRRGYVVWGTSRDAQGSSFKSLQFLGIRDKIHLLSMVPEDFRSVYMALRRSEPDEIYYLAAQSSVGLSFEQPVETIQRMSSKPKSSCDPPTSRSAAPRLPRLQRSWVGRRATGCAMCESLSDPAKPALFGLDQ